MKAKEEWIKETMECLTGIKSQEPNPYLFEKIQSRLESRTANVIRPKFALSLIACILLLAGINFLSCIRYEKKNAVSTNIEVKTFYSEYFSYLNSTTQF